MRQTGVAHAAAEADVVRVHHDIVEWGLTRAWEMKPLINVRMLLPRCCCCRCCGCCRCCCRCCCCCQERCSNASLVVPGRSHFFLLSQGKVLMKPLDAGGVGVRGKQLGPVVDAQIRYLLVHPDASEDAVLAHLKEFVAGGLKP